jgi:large subunit ribosomal protein L13
MQKTIITKHKNIKREWFLIDAENEILGRLASKIAYILMGKHKAEYYPGMDLGDYIIIINSEKVRLTGDKYKKKIYYRHSGYMGGLKKESFMDKMRKNKSREILYDAIKGMLPKNKLGRKMIKKLKISEGNKNVFIAQKPKRIIL